MKRVLKWFGFTVAAIVILIVGILATTWAVANNRANRTYDVEVPHVDVPTDPVSIAEGARLTTSRLCFDCHGDDLGGAELVDDPMLGRVWATNLTTGEGGVGSDYDAHDFARAVWFGVRPDGSPIAVMPSSEYHQAFDPAQLGKVIAYVRSVPPVDRETPSFRLMPLGWTLYAFGELPLMHIEIMDASTPPPQNIQVEVSADYGATIGIMCTGCHGADLAGATDPTGRISPNLTPHASGLRGWTLVDFTRGIRSGVLPDGSVMSFQAHQLVSHLIPEAEAAVAAGCKESLPGLIGQRLSHWRFMPGEPRHQPASLIINGNDIGVPIVGE